MVRRLSVRAALGLALSLAALTAAVAAVTAMASTFNEVRANEPQVQGSPTSNTTAVFPTNKQNEPTVAVNPASASFLIAGSNDEQRQPPCGPGPVRGAAALANDCGFFPGVGTSGIYTSSDGGQTWTNRGLLDDQASWIASDLVSDGDPVIVYGPKPSGSGFSYASGARAYYATLASYKAGKSPYPPNKAPELLAVSYSDDNGATWSKPAIVTTKENPNDFNDKEAIWADDLPTSPFFGRVYVTWTEFRSIGGSPDPIQIATSTNGGATFGAPNQLSQAQNNNSQGGRQGSAVRSGPDGTLYVAWSDSGSQVVAVSRDGGKKWTRPVKVGAAPGIKDPIPGSNFRTNDFPSVAADPRSGSTTAYVAWAADTGSGGRMLVSRSTNRGATWSAATTVSTPAEGYAFYQGLDVAPNGRVDLAYQAQDSSATTWGTGNAAIDSWYVSSANGTSWSTPVKVTTASSDPAASAQNNLARQFFGDYNTLVSTNANAWFIYTDTRSGLGCADVDDYQTAIAGTAAVHGDMADRVAARLGQDPASHAPGEKPAPQEHCGGQFGNSDAFVSRIAP